MVGPGFREDPQGERHKEIIQDVITLIVWVEEVRKELDPKNVLLSKWKRS